MAATRGQGLLELLIFYGRETMCRHITWKRTGTAGMNRTCIREGAPFSEEYTAEIIHAFKRDGFTIGPGVLEQEEISAIRARIDEMFDPPELAALTESGHKGGNEFIIWHINELDRIFCELLIREPIYSLMESIFGPGFQQCGNQILRNGSGQHIERWHCDGPLWFPLPDEVLRHDRRIEMPVFWLTVQIALSDITSIGDGPSQYVPGSHYSGRKPPEKGEPEFEGQGPVSILCRAGDIYLHNSQCWHRGTPNQSGRLRYLLQQQYGQEWAFRRYNAYINYKMPDSILEDADERLLNVLGSFRFEPEEFYRHNYF